MLATKRQLEVDVEHLEARLKMSETAVERVPVRRQPTQPHRELVGELRTRLDVAERMVEADVAVQSEIPLETAAPANIVEQVADYFQAHDTDVAETGDRRPPSGVATSPDRKGGEIRVGAERFATSFSGRSPAASAHVTIEKS